MEAHTVCVLVFLAIITVAVKPREAHDNDHNDTATDGVKSTVTPHTHDHNHTDQSSKHRYNTEGHLISELLDNHHPLALPTQVVSKPIVVELSMMLTNLMEIDESKQIMHSKARIRQRWKNAQLSWNPDDYEGIEKISLPSDKVWKPDLYILNNAHPDWQHFATVPLRLRYDGTVYYSAPTEIITFCELDLSDFPFDAQTCHIQIGSWMEGKERIDIRLYNNISVIDVSYAALSAEWNFKATEARRKVETVASGSYAEITFSLTVKRKSGFYKYNFIIPVIIVQAVTLMVFWVPVDSQEKITLSVGALVALTVLNVDISVKMPPLSGRHIPAILKFYAFTFIMVTVAVGASVIILGLHHRRPRRHIRHLPAWVKTIFLNGLGRLCRVAPPSMFGTGGRLRLGDHGETDNYEGDGMRDMSNKDPGSVNDERLREIIAHQLREDAINEALEEWALLGVIIDRCFFAVYFCCFVIGWIVVTK